MIAGPPQLPLQPLWTTMADPGSNNLAVKSILKIQLSQTVSQKTAKVPLHRKVSILPATTPADLTSQVITKIRILS